MLLTALFLCALSLRPQIIGIGPLLPRIQADLGATHGVVGLLSTLPVLCMGVFAPVAGVIAGRIGAKQAITLSLAANGIFGIARAFAPGTASLLVLTVAVGLPIAIAGALLPVVVKQSFAHQPALATAMYTAGIQIGSVSSAGIAAPLAVATGSWRPVLAVFSLTILGTTGVWLWAARGYHTPRHGGSPPGLPLGSGMAWLLVVIFFLQAVPYYGLSAWLPSFLLENGWPEARAGGSIALMNVGTLTGTLGIAPFADRRGARRSYLAASSLVVTLGTIGLLLAPGMGALLCIVVGVALGTLFPLVLTLPLDVASRPADVGAVTAMMFGIGYTLAALAPTGLGFIRDLSGDFNASLWVLVGVSALLTALTLMLSPRRLADGIPGRV